MSYVRASGGELDRAELLRRRLKQNTTTPNSTTSNKDARSNQNVLTPFERTRIGFFVPDSDKEPTTTVGSYTHYHNVYAFIKRVRVMAEVVAEDCLAQRLDECLLGRALIWWDEELSKESRANLRASLDVWCKELEERFKLSPLTVQVRLQGLRYGIDHVQMGRDPLAFVHKAFLYEKNCQLDSTDATRMYMICQKFDPQLRKEAWLQLESLPSKEGLYQELLRLQHLWDDIFRVPLLPPT